MNKKELNLEETPQSISPHLPTLLKTFDVIYYIPETRRWDKAMDLSIFMFSILGKVLVSENRNFRVRDVTGKVTAINNKLQLSSYLIELENHD